MRKLIAFFLLTALSIPAAPPLYAGDDAVPEVHAVWNKDTGFKGWRPRSNLPVTDTGTSLVLTIKHQDPQLRIDKLNIDPARCDTFVYTYRAEGTGPRTGQLFFAADGGRIGDSDFWHLPPLIADGKIHRVEIPASKLCAPKRWYGAGRITSLRFDPTDSPGGQLEIFELKLEKRQRTAFPGIAWNGKNRFKGWRPNSRIGFKNTGKSLELEFKVRDPKIIIEKLKLDPRQYNTFVYTYRAQGTGPRTGQLFFAADGGKIGDANFWRLPAPVADGRIHRVEIPVSALVRPANWYGAKEITTLRFDPTDSPGGKMEIFELKLEKRPDIPIPPVSRQWQNIRQGPELDAPVWQPVRAKFDSSDLRPPAEIFSRNSSYFGGKMIYADGDLPPELWQSYQRAKRQNRHRDFYLRKEFELKAAPERAMLQIVADDMAKVYINGQYAGQTVSWKETVTLDIKKFLQPGRNLLAIHYVNGYMAGGVLAELFASFTDNTFIRIDTDNTFTGTKFPPENWNRLNADTSSFKPVVTLPPPPAYPWNHRAHYTDFSASRKLCSMRFVPRRLLGGDDIKLEFEFEGDMPELPASGEVLLKRGEKIAWQEKIIISGAVRQKANGRWELSIPYNVPEYIRGGRFDLELKCGALHAAGNRKLQQPVEILRRPAPKGFENKPVCVVKTGVYGPYFELNGKPFYYSAGRYHTFTRPDPPTNTVVVMPSWAKWWNDKGELDFTEFDRAAEVSRRNNGDNYFLWDLIIYIPDAILAQYPDAICRDDRGDIVRNPKTTHRLCHSYASKVVLQKMQQAVLKAIDHLEKSPYANRIIGYRISGGYTIEWLAWQAGAGRCLDFSPAAQAGFREFARKHYPDLKDTGIPTLYERTFRDNGELIRDPVKYRKAAAFTDYYSTACADYVIALCGAVKKKLNHQKLVGSYYGYTMTLNADGNSQMRGHYALKKLLDSKTVDFLMSPQPYNVRNFGDTYGDMKPFATMKNHHIVPIHEDDTRTHKGMGDIGYFQAPNVELCVEMIRRSIGFNLCRNLPLFFIPMPGNYEFPEARRELKIAETVGQHCLEKQVPRKAEIALIVSERSIINSPMGHPRIATGEVQQRYGGKGEIITDRNEHKAAFTHDSFGRNYTLWSRLGAPADYLLAEDIADNPGDYKMYVFVNPVFTDKNLIKAAEMLRQKKCMILWMYAPGYSAYDGNSVKNMKLLTGLDFRRADRDMMPALTMTDGRKMGNLSVRMAPLFSVTAPGGEILGRYEDGSAGAAVCRTGRAQSVFCGVWRPDLKFIRDLARRAGVKIYSDSGDPLEANGALVSLHARSAGLKTVRLPRKTDVLDVFNKKIIAGNTDCFTFNADLHDSPLFYYGSDADELLKKLEAIK